MAVRSVHIRPHYVLVASDHFFWRDFLFVEVYGALLCSFTKYDAKCNKVIWYAQNDKCRAMCHIAWVQKA